MQPNNKNNNSSMFYTALFPIIAQSAYIVLLPSGGLEVPVAIAALTVHNFHSLEKAGIFQPASSLRRIVIMALANSNTMSLLHPTRSPSYTPGSSSSNVDTIAIAEGQ